jgi:uncharacterized protein involved in outer membrane biogenesis
MLGIIFSIFQFIIGTIVAIIGLIALYVLIFDWDKFK